MNYKYRLLHIDHARGERQREHVIHCIDEVPALDIASGSRYFLLILKRYTTHVLLGPCCPRIVGPAVVHPYIHRDTPKLLRTRVNEEDHVFSPVHRADE
ncbi:hypothetical protein CSUI_006444 [Cystoisospora suis]|uniref:Uncharacterized protein n=1 Tax=Cystoisospora suis TaxID=483139 RepID=A0A2C6K0H3_9APIC|nr:hypothetical protein CSUI_006444 [Cystoisospora suis]